MRGRFGGCSSDWSLAPEHEHGMSLAQQAHAAGGDPPASQLECVGRTCRLVTCPVCQHCLVIRRSGWHRPPTVPGTLQRIAERIGRLSFGSWHLPFANSGPLTCGRSSGPAACGPWRAWPRPVAATLRPRAARQASRASPGSWSGSCTALLGAHSMPLLYTPAGWGAWVQVSTGQHFLPHTCHHLLPVAMRSLGALLSAVHTLLFGHPVLQGPPHASAPPPYCTTTAPSTQQVPAAAQPAARSGSCTCASLQPALRLRMACFVALLWRRHACVCVGLPGPHRRPARPNPGSHHPDRRGGATRLLRGARGGPGGQRERNQKGLLSAGQEVPP